MNRKTWAILSTAAIALLTIFLMRPSIEPTPAQPQPTVGAAVQTPSVSEPSRSAAVAQDAPVSLETSTPVAPAPLAEAPAAVLPPREERPHHPGEFVDEATIRKLHGDQPLNASHPHVAGAIEIQERNNRWLMAHPAVAGTAIGLNDEGRVALIIYTKVDAPELPKEVEKLPVAVYRSGEFSARRTAQEIEVVKDGAAEAKPAGGSSAVNPAGWFARPVPIGVSTGHPLITAGTIGCSVQKDGLTYALSNNHVFANSNDATILLDNVLQPGPYDGGGKAAGRDDVIGTLAAFEPIQFNGNQNVIDAAIVLVKTLDNGTAALGKSTPSGGYGTPKQGPMAPALKMKVQKYGRTTGQTTGTIGSLNGTANINYGAPGTTDKVALFVGQIFINSGAFSAGGDSGSLIVSSLRGSDNKRPVGLLFAGGSGLTIANPIDDVLQKLGVTIIGD